MRRKEYLKYSYWLKPEHVDDVRSELKSKDIRLKWARGVVCTPLDPLNRITMVEPRTWDETCERQGSWYRISPRAGQYLLVSSFPVHHPACTPNTVIRESAFDACRQATTEERERLLRSEPYVKKVPAQWARMDEREKKRWKVWLSKINIDVNLDLLLEIHSANHANFLEPSFFVKEDGRVVPYSIDLSSHLCSCCLEMYNVVGDRFPRKLVRPCLGALYFARLEPDRFYEVITVGDAA